MCPTTNDEKKKMDQGKISFQYCLLVEGFLPYLVNGPTGVNPILLETGKSTASWTLVFTSSHKFEFNKSPTCIYNSIL